VSYAEEIVGEYQGGLQRGRSSADQIFTARQIFEKCWKQNVYVHILFIDFQAAYNIEWSEMNKLCLPKKSVKFCTALDNDIYGKVKWVNFYPLDFMLLPCSKCCV
jgi:hypothetical protein